MNMAAKISIVLPVHNGESRLTEALECLLNQTLQEIELVCVDDASTDGTARIIEAYQAKDPRVVLVRHEKNRGSLMARKTGTLQASGEYLMYMDHDDAFVPEACATLLRAMEESGAEMIHFGTQYVNEEGFQTAPETGSLFERDAADAGAWEGVQPGRELLERFFIAKDLHWAIWNKIYRADLAKRVFGSLEEAWCTLGEDMLVTFLMLTNATRVAYLREKLYVYRMGLGITSKLSKNKARAVANEYRVYQMLRDGLTEEQLQDPSISAALEIVHDDLMAAVLWNMLHVEDDAALETMITSLAEHCDALTLWRELQRYHIKMEDQFQERIGEMESFSGWEHEQWDSFEKQLREEIAQLYQGLEEKDRYYEGVIALHDQQAAQELEQAKQRIASLETALDAEKRKGMLKHLKTKWETERRR